MTKARVHPLKSSEKEIDKKSLRKKLKCGAVGGVVSLAKNVMALVLLNSVDK